MHVVIATPFASPEKGACSIRVAAFATALESKGHRVTVLAPARKGVPSQENTIRYTGRTGLLPTILSLPNVDVVIGTSPPLPPNFWAWLACQVKSIPFILDAKDPFVEVYTAAGTLQEGNWKHSLYTWMESLLHTRADAISTLTPRDIEYIHSRHRVAKENIFLIPNGFSPRVMKFNSAARKKWRSEWNITPRERALVYTGSLQDERIHEFIAHAGKEFLSKKNLHIILVVAVEQKPEDQAIIKNLRHSSHEKEKNRIHIIENAPYENVSDYLSAADAAIVPVPLSWKNCLPVKALDSAAIGLPIFGVGPSDSSFSDFISESKGGWLDSDWVSLLHRIEENISNGLTLKRMGKNAHAFVKKYYNRDESAQRMIDLVEKFEKK